MFALLDKKSFGGRKFILLLCILLFSTMDWSIALTEKEEEPEKKSRAKVEITIDDKGIKIGGIEVPSDSSPADTSQKEVTVAVTEGDVVKFGESVVVQEGVRIDGDVVTIGGSVTVLGEIDGNVVAIGGGVTVDSTGIIDGDAVSIGGAVEKKAGGRIRGETVSLGIKGFKFFPKGPKISFPMPLSPSPWFDWLSRFTGFLIKIIWVGVLIVLALLTVIFFPNPPEAVAQAIKNKPMRVTLVGVLGEILICPLIVALVISILGIPLIPLAIILILIAFLLGFVGISLYLGRNFQLGRLKVSSPLGAVALGGLLVNLVWLLGSLIGIGGFIFSGIGGFTSFLGFLIAYVAWTVGFGASLLTRFGTKPLTNGTGVIAEAVKSQVENKKTETTEKREL